VLDINFWQKGQYRPSGFSEIGDSCFLIGVIDVLFPSRCDARIGKVLSSKYHGCVATYLPFILVIGALYRQ
jgi:uncharacterized protein (UPF0261 family)